MRIKRQSTKKCRVCERLCNGTGSGHNIPDMRKWPSALVAKRTTTTIVQKMAARAPADNKPLKNDTETVSKVRIAFLFLLTTDCNRIEA